MGAIECCLARSEDCTEDFEITHPLIGDEAVPSVSSPSALKNFHGPMRLQAKRNSFPADSPDLNLESGNGAHEGRKKVKTLEEIRHLGELHDGVREPPFSKEEDIWSRKMWFALFAAAVIARFNVLGGIVACLLIIVQVLCSSKLRPASRNLVATSGQALRLSVKGYGRSGVKKRHTEPESEPSEGGQTPSSADECRTTAQDMDASSEFGDASLSPEEKNYEGLPFTYSEMLDKVSSLREKIADMGLKPAFKLDCGPDGEYVDSTLLRFIVANEGHVMKSANMLKKYTAWRTKRYQNSIPPSEWISETSGDQAGLLMIDFVTNTGKPVVIIRGRYRKKGRPAEVTRDFCVGVVDAVSAIAQKLQLQNRYKDEETGKPLNPLGKFCCILDLGSFGYANADLDGLLEVGKILFQYFPEYLGSVWIIHSNFIFAAMWSVIQVFLPKRNLGKYVFFKSEEEYKAFFPTVIDPERLPKRYGGLAEDRPKEYIGRYLPKGSPEYVTANL